MTTVTLSASPSVKLTLRFGRLPSLRAMPSAPPEATGARKANASPACTDHAAFGFEREVPLGLIWSAAPLTREIAQPVHGGIAEMCTPFIGELAPAPVALTTGPSAPEPPELVPTPVFTFSSDDPSGTAFRASGSKESPGEGARGRGKGCMVTQDVSGRSGVWRRFVLVTAAAASRWCGDRTTLFAQ